jgi:hypothetical protein
MGQTDPRDTGEIIHIKIGIPVIEADHPFKNFEEFFIRIDIVTLPLMMMSPVDMSSVRHILPFQDYPFLFERYHYIIKYNNL